VRDEIYLDCLIARPVVMSGSRRYIGCPPGIRAAPRALLGRGDRPLVAHPPVISLATSLKPCRTQLGISDRVLDILVARIGLRLKHRRALWEVVRRFTQPSWGAAPFREGWANSEISSSEPCKRRRDGNVRPRERRRSWHARAARLERVFDRPGRREACGRDL